MPVVGLVDIQKIRLSPIWLQKKVACNRFTFILKVTLSWCTFFWTGVKLIGKRNNAPAAILQVFG